MDELRRGDVLAGLNSDAQQRIGLPSSIFGTYAGAAALFQQSQSSQLWLIGIAIAVIYVILGMLYESWVHPVTTLLGVPSAAVGGLIFSQLITRFITPVLFLTFERLAGRAPAQGNSTVTLTPLP